MSVDGGVVVLFVILSCSGYRLCQCFTLALVVMVARCAEYSVLAVSYDTLVDAFCAAGSATINQGTPGWPFCCVCINKLTAFNMSVWMRVGDSTFHVKCAAASFVCWQLNCVRLMGPPFCPTLMAVVPICNRTVTRLWRIQPQCEFMGGWCVVRFMRSVGVAR